MTSVTMKPYVVVIELTWDNGTWSTELDAVDAADAYDRALERLFPDEYDVEYDDETGERLGGSGDHDEVRRSWVVQGVLEG